MSVAKELTYFGLCNRFRDGSAYVEVRGQFDGAATRDLSQSSRNLFPPQGEVELRTTSGAVNRGDWIAFGVESYGPPGHPKFRAVDACRLLPFEDLADIGDAEAVRHLLVEDGRVEDFPGPRYVRIGDREVVRIEIQRERDGRWRGVPENDFLALAVWEYRPELRIAVNDGERSMFVLDTRAPLRQIGTTNWTSDAELVRKIVGAMRAKTDSEDTARRQFADALLRYADQLQRDAEPSARGFDPFASRNILRVRRVASVLRDKQDVLQEYFDFLREDPAVKELIEKKVAAVVEEEAASQRTMIKQTLALELDREMAELRKTRQSELEKSIGDLDAEMMGELERRAASRSAEVDQQIADLEQQHLTQLEQALGTKRATLEAEVSGLEEHRAALATETYALENRSTALKVEVQRLSEEQIKATEIVERWTSVARALGTGAEPFGATRISVPLSERPLSTPPQSLQPRDFEGAVADCSLLSDAGKDMLVRLVALMLAGEIPLLHGSQSDDFIEIAQTFISGGRHARLEADPTVISFDDLWIRPGTQVATPLRQAVAEASEGPPRTQLCVISRADQSGARFWYPALAEKTRRTELPAHLLICATLTDAQSEEAAEFAGGGLLLETNDLIAPKAWAVAPAMLTGPQAKIFELYIPERPSDLTAAVRVLASIGVPLGIRQAERVARIYVVAGTMMKPAEAESLARYAASRFATPTLAGRNGDNVIALGEASRA